MEVDKSAKPSFFELRIRWRGLVVAGGVVCLAATMFGFLASLSWFLELFAHFRVQYFIALALCGGMAAWRREHKWTIAFTAGTVVNLCTIVPLYIGSPTPPFEFSERPLRVVVVNVNREFGSVTRVGEMLNRLDPDIVVLQEVNARWLSDLESFTAKYPHSSVRPREDNFGIALYCKLPLQSSEVVRVGTDHSPSIVAVVETQSRLLKLIATHPFPPAGPHNSSVRNSQLEGIAQHARASSRPLLLVGDLNVTPWSPHFRRLTRDGDLLDSTRGRGVQPTWPTWMPLLLIPIDHCLHSRDILITRRELGPYVGSDHFPLVVDFALQSPS